MVRSYRVKLPFVDGILLFIFFLSEFRKDPLQGLPRLIYVPTIQRDRFRYLELLGYLTRYQNQLTHFLQTVQKRANAGQATEMR